MKEILLMRHAKSSWDDSSLRDFDRPLANRGNKDAPRMAEFLVSNNNLPDKIISSPALRAKETSEHLTDTAGKAGLNVEIEWEDNLYYGSAFDYVKTIQAAKAGVHRLMLVGHNPLMEQTASILSGYEQNIGIRMPTAALVCLESHASSWNDVGPGTCHIKWMMIPKVLKDSGQ